MANPAFPWAGRYVKDGELRQIIELAAGKAHTLARPTQTVRVVQGNAWITLDGEDYLIKAGQEVMVQVQKAPAVISSPNDEPLIFEVR
jgi:quercetin dioxygenase-like cupin family protein